MHSLHSLQTALTMGLSGGVGRHSQLAADGKSCSCRDFSSLLRSAWTASGYSGMQTQDGTILPALDDPSQ
jgi:hypothetical protein